MDNLNTKNIIKIKETELLNKKQSYMEKKKTHEINKTSEEQKLKNILEKIKVIKKSRRENRIDYFLVVLILITILIIESMYSVLELAAYFEMIYSGTIIFFIGASVIYFWLSKDSKQKLKNLLEEKWELDKVIFDNTFFIKNYEEKIKKYEICLEELKNIDLNINNVNLNSNNFLYNKKNEEQELNKNKIKKLKYEFTLK